MGGCLRIKSRSLISGTLGRRGRKFFVSKCCGWPLKKFCDSSTTRSKSVDLCRDLLVFDQWRSMMSFASRVNDQGPSASPVFLVDETPNSLDVRGWIASSKRSPQKVVERAACKLRVVHQYDQSQPLPTHVFLQCPVFGFDYVGHFLCEKPKRASLI